MAGRAVVGLDIGSSGVRAAQLVRGRGGGTTLERLGQVALPPGAVRDGEVVDVETTAAAVRTLWAQTGFTTRRVVVGVANQKVVVRQVDLPLMPLEELRASLPYHVQDAIPMPVEQAVLDFHPYDEDVDAEGARRLRVLLVAASREMVSRTMETVQAAGLQPVGIDLTSFAVLRALATAGGVMGSAEAEALVDIGASVTNLVVQQAGVPRFVRILLMGGGHVTDTVSERLGISADEAEAAKRGSAMPAVPGLPSPDPVVRAVEASAGPLVEEIRGSLDYYLAQPGAVRIGRVVLSGGGSRLSGLADRLAAATNLPVSEGSVLSSLTLGRTGLTDEQLGSIEPLVTVPVGLAMGMAS